MTRVKIFSDVVATDVTREVEDFINKNNEIQILYINWFVKGHETVCIITYFEV